MNKVSCLIRIGNGTLRASKIDADVLGTWLEDGELTEAKGKAPSLGYPWYLRSGIKSVFLKEKP